MNRQTGNHHFGDPPDLNIASTPRGVVEEIRFTAQQGRLLRALEQKDKRLGIMYFGGIAVLAQLRNPDRLALCAHAMRELMEKLPDYLDVATQATNVDIKLRAKVQALQDAFVGLSYKEGGEPATVGGRAVSSVEVHAFLDKCVAFFKWFALPTPRRKAMFVSVMPRLDPLRRSMPDALATLKAEEWERMREYFTGVSHHNVGKLPSEEEFVQQLDALDQFLVGMLAPRVTEDFSEIDAIIASGGDSG